MDYLGAFIPAFFLFYAWTVIVAVVSGAIWAGARLRGANQRTVLISVVPYFAGSFRAMTRLIAPFLIIVVVWVALQQPDMTSRIPAPSAKAYEYGEYVFIVAFLLFAAVYVPRAYGVSILARLEELDERQRFPIMAMRFFGLTFIASLISMYRGPLCWFAVFLIFAYSGGIALITLYTAGLKKFAAAPRIAPKPVEPEGPLLFLQVSDVHVTAQESGVPTGGGRSGLEELRRIGAALASGELAAKLMVVSGDLVDRGDEEEWKRALPALREIRRQGARVILAPGNHDLLPSYSPWRLFWAAIRPGVVTPVVEGAQVRRYLEAAVELEPHLCTWDGVPLKSFLKAYDSPWRELLAAWDKARDQMVADLGLPAGTDHVTAFTKSRRAQPEKHARLEAELIAEATRLYPEPAGYWRTNLYVVNPRTVAEFFQHDPWHGKWYEPYPLRIGLETAHGQAEVFVLNSSPRDPLFAQSSLGLTGAQQMERLGHLLDASPAKLLMVVHHHSFLRWENESFRFERWAILSHDAAESRRLAELLKSSAREGRDIVVMTGHTHGASRSGYLPAKEGANYGLWYLESAALGETGSGQVVLAGALDGARRFQAGMLRLRTGLRSQASSSHSSR